MQEYFDVLDQILSNPIIKKDNLRNINTITTRGGARFQYLWKKERYEMPDNVPDLYRGRNSTEYIDVYRFPMLTTKKIFKKNIIGETLWFLSGSNNLKDLKDRGVNYWDKDAYNYYRRLYDLGMLDYSIWGNQGGHVNINNNEDGKTIMIPFPLNFEEFKYQAQYYDFSLGYVYGYNWRNFNGYDQVVNVLNNMIQNPTSRRHLITSWRPDKLYEVVLPPCHVSYQLVIDDNKNCDLIMTQRSADLGLGLPMNIITYALIQQIFCHITGCTPNSLQINIGDAHIYENHLIAILEQKSREPFPLPKLIFSDNFNSSVSELKENITTKSFNIFISKLGMDDFIIKDYKHHPHIKMEMLAPKSYNIN